MLANSEIGRPPINIAVSADNQHDINVFGVHKIYDIDEELKNTRRNAKLVVVVLLVIAGSTTEHHRHRQDRCQIVELDTSAQNVLLSVSRCSKFARSTYGLLRDSCELR